MVKAMKQKFKGVVSSDGNGHIVVNLSGLPADAGLIIEGLNGRSVQFREPVREQINKPNPRRAKAATAAQTDDINASVDKRAYNIGDVLPDGWVVGPRSPKTGIVMAIEPVSGALDGYKTWHQGEDHAKELREKGHANARQPSADNNNDELNAIYKGVVKAGRNGNAKLNTSGSLPYGKYWSGTTLPDGRDLARVHYFVVGTRDWDFKFEACARVRCVRDEPGITLA